MNTDFPLKAQDAIIGDVIIYPEMGMSRTEEKKKKIFHIIQKENNRICLLLIPEALL